MNKRDDLVSFILFYFYDLKNNKYISDLSYLLNNKCNNLRKLIKTSTTPGDLIRKILKCTKDSLKEIK